MKNALRRSFLLAGLAVMWAATPCFSADASNLCTRASLNNPGDGSGGMGGTGVIADAALAPGSGGMGGTGIVGIITGFASICVNDVEVHYDARTPVSVNGRAAAARDLAVGQLVVVHASAAGGQFRASGIGAIDAVNGPVTRVDTAAREIQVMDQTVRLANAIVPDLAAIKPGMSVRVSGLRTENGIIVATRLDAVPAVARASLLGIVSSAEGNSAVVNGTRVNLPQRAPAQSLAVGSEVFVAGEWNGSTLQARRVEAQPVRNAIARAERAIVEGFVTGHRGNQVNIGAITVQLSDGVRVTGGSDRDVNVGRKVQVEIRRTGDTWLADRVILQRSDNVRGETRKIPPAATGDSRGDQEARPGRDEGTGAQDSGGRDNSGGANSGSSGRSDASGSGSSDSGSANTGSGSSGSGSSNSASGNSTSSRSESNSSGSRSSGSGSGRSGSSSGERSSGSGSSTGSGSRSSGSRGGIR